MPRRSTFLRILGGSSLAIVGVLYVWLIWDVFQNDGKQLTTLAPKGPSAQTIQDLVVPVFAIAGVVFVGVLGAILYITWRFREDPDDDTMPGQLHGKTTLEIGWTILPAVLLAGIAVFTVITILKLEDRSDDALKVRVYGQQWWWSYDYDVDGDGSYNGEGDITAATELVVPAGREVDLVISSNDVIHSYWIPALSGKRDAVPGMDNFWKIEADEPGVFRGQCTEYCGLSHANMRMIVRALEPADYDRWLANQLEPPDEPAAGSLAAAGKDQFSALCAQCHVVNGQFEKAKDDPASVPLVSGIAPDLSYFMTRGTFAGSIFNLWSPEPPTQDDPTGNARDVAEPGDPGEALFGGESQYYLNRPILEAWLRNPTALKPAYPDQNADGKGRGMPNLGLSEQQIDELVAYLETLR
jgi:cytochrome c oxidase subunit II